MLHRIPSVLLQRFSLIAASVGLVLFLLPEMAAAQESAPEVQLPDTADAVVQIRGMAC